MALALEDLLDSFGSSSFAVHPQPEKDLRASLDAAFATTSSHQAPSFYPSAGPSTGGERYPIAIGGRSDPWYPSRTAGPPPNTPMGTPLRPDGFPSSSGSGGSYGIASVDMNPAVSSPPAPTYSSSDPSSSFSAYRAFDPSSHHHHLSPSAFLSPPPSPHPSPFHPVSHPPSHLPIPPPPTPTTGSTGCRACDLERSVSWPAAAAAVHARPPASSATHDPLCHQSRLSSHLAHLSQPSPWGKASRQLPSPSPSPSPGRSPYVGDGRADDVVFMQ